MSAPKWEDVEVGDAVIAERRESDATVAGTVGDTNESNGLYVGFGVVERFGIYTKNWTLLDIIKPGPQLPTATGSLVRVRDSNHFYMRAEDDGWYCSCGLHDVDAPTDWELIYDAGKLVYDAGKK